MMKKIILLMMMMIFLLASVSAELTYWQQKWEGDGVGDVPIGTTRIHSVVTYNADDNNFVTGGNKFEFYFWYDIYVETWNEMNPDFPVDWCNLTIRQYPASSSVPALVYSRLFTDDYNNAKYFLRLDDGDVVFADIDCHFNSTNSSLYVPATLQVVTPTWECQACQYYEWTLVERNIVKAKSVGSNIVDTTESMKNVIILNFEIWLALFWIVLIVVAVHSTGLLFIGIIWLFAYMKNLIK